MQQEQRHLEMILKKFPGMPKRQAAAISLYMCHGWAWTGINVEGIHTIVRESDNLKERASINQNGEFHYAKDKKDLKVNPKMIFKLK